MPYCQLDRKNNLGSLMNERQLEKWARTQAIGRGVLPYKFKSPAKRGVPDQLWLYKGRAVFIEFKNPNGKGVLSALQRKEIDLLLDQGFVVAVASSKETVLDILNVLINNGEIL